MALFDNINSRYTRSMEHGGSYERDAAVGGYDRKELRGLIKQAKSGTLTQRERARYNYLKDERGGRRKRGLLAGLGAAGAVLAGLAASGKLGGGGGEGGGLMDMIKGRLAGAQEKSRLKKFRKEQGEEFQDMLIEDAQNFPPKRTADYDPNIEDIDLIEEEEFPSSPDDELRASSNRDKNPRVTDDPEVNKITMEAIKEGGRSTSELMNSRQPGQIQTNRPEKNLPQLEALEQLRHFFGNRYN